MLLDKNLQHLGTGHICKQNDIFKIKIRYIHFRIGIYRQLISILLQGNQTQHRFLHNI